MNTSSHSAPDRLRTQDAKGCNLSATARGFEDTIMQVQQKREGRRARKNVVVPSLGGATDKRCGGPPLTLGSLLGVT